MWSRTRYGLIAASSKLARRTAAASRRSSASPTAPSLKLPPSSAISACSASRSASARARAGFQTPFQQAAHGLRRLGHWNPRAGRRRRSGSPGAWALSSRSPRISTMVALLWLALLLSPGGTAAKALQAFSRRSRRAELFRNGSTEERDSVTIALPCHAALPGGGALAPVDKAFRQALEIGLAERQGPGLLVAEKMVAEGGAKMGQPLIDPAASRAFAAARSLRPRGGSGVYVRSKQPPFPRRSFRGFFLRLSCHRRRCGRTAPRSS